jgi:hypothetical protein
MRVLIFSNNVDWKLEMPLGAEALLGFAFYHFFGVATRKCNTEIIWVA